MRWKKIGRIFAPDAYRKDMNCPTPAWMISHASVPIAELIADDLFNIYFSCRDSHNRSVTGRLVIDLKRPLDVLAIDHTPILQPGQLGTFDDSGAMASWITNVEDKTFMYYVGWNLGVTVPFRNAIGLAVRDPGGAFKKPYQAPIVDRSIIEPYFCASCAVLHYESLWRMWYVSCCGWESLNGIPRHRYNLRYAESSDGISWIRNGEISIDFASKNEYAISRPSVLPRDDGWHMWYSYRGDRYQIGYAFSADGRCWSRQDEKSGIKASSSGWDSEMIEYPFVFIHKNQTFMLYNGNGYGYTGFGLAVLE